MSFPIYATHRKPLYLFLLPLLILLLLGGCVQPPAPAPQNEPAVAMSTAVAEEEITPSASTEPAVAPPDVPLSERRQVPVEHCMRPFATSEAEAKAELLAEAKRQAVMMLYGEEVGASTLIRDFALVEDEIWSRLEGRVWLVASPEYTSGTNLGEMCISAEYFITEEDWRTYSAKRIALREMCKLVSDAKKQGIEAERFTKDAALIAALYAFNGGLRSVPENSLLRLPQEVAFEGEGAKLSGNVASYCVTGLTAFVLPDEVRVLVEQFGGSGLPATATPTSAVTPTGIQILKPTLTPTSMETKLSPTASGRSQRATVEGICLNIGDYSSEAAVNNELFQRAEMKAIERIFGATILAESETENFRLVMDRVRRLVAGRVHLEGDETYIKTGDDKQLCISATFYATEADFLAFAPELISGEAIRNPQQAQGRDLREFTIEEAELDAFYNKDRGLRGIERDLLLRLMQGVSYEIDRSLQNAAWHVKLSGYVIPFEIELLVTATPVPTATPTPMPTSTATATPTATSRPTATDTVTSTTTPTPMPMATDTPTATVTDTPIPTATATPSATATSTQPALPTPTFTPRPVTPRPVNTATPTPRPGGHEYGAPQLSSPTDGQRFDAATTPVLAWGGGPLKPGDYFVVWTRHSGGSDFQVTAQTSLTAPSFLQKNNWQNGFPWQVAICRGGTPGGSGQLPCVLVSPWSEERTFHWERSSDGGGGNGPPPTPTIEP